MSYQKTFGRLGIRLSVDALTTPEHIVTYPTKTDYPFCRNKKIRIL